MRSVEVVKQLWRELPCLDGKETWGVKSMNHLSLKNTRNLFTPRTIDNASLSMCVCTCALSLSRIVAQKLLACHRHRA